MPGRILMILYSVSVSSVILMSRSFWLWVGLEEWPVFLGSCSASAVVASA